MASIYDWSKTAASNSNADAAINWAEGMDPAAVNDSARQEMARIAEFRDDITGTISAGGTANSLTVTANSGFTTLANGRMVAFIAASDNTGAATLAVNGLTTASIRKFITGDSALQGGEIRAGGIYLVRYNSALNGGAGGWLLINPTQGGLSLFTPTLNFGGASVGITYATQTGYYAKVGNVIVAHIRLILSSKGSSVGNANIAGLPFSSTLLAPALIAGYQNFSGLTGVITAVINSGILNLGQTSSTAGNVAVTNANFTNTSEIDATAVYISGS